MYYCSEFYSFLAELILNAPPKIKITEAKLKYTHSLFSSQVRGAMGAADSL